MATYVSLAAGQEQASVVVRGALVGLATYLEKRIALVAKQSGEAMKQSQADPWASRAKGGRRLHSDLHDEVVAPLDERLIDHRHLRGSQLVVSFWPATQLSHSHTGHSRTVTQVTVQWLAVIGWLTHSCAPSSPHRRRLQLPCATERLLDTEP